MFKELQNWAVDSLIYCFIRCKAANVIIPKEAFDILESCEHFLKLIAKDPRVTPMTYAVEDLKAISTTYIISNEEPCLTAAQSVMDFLCEKDITPSTIANYEAKAIVSSCNDNELYRSELTKIELSIPKVSNETNQEKVFSPVLYH